MNKIKIILFGKLRILARQREIDLVIAGNTSLADLIEHLSDLYGHEIRKVLNEKQHYNILVNGMIIKNDYNTSKIPEGAEIALLPIITAG